MAYDQSNPFGATSGKSPYDVIRKQAVDRSQGAGQSGMDALTRRFAAMGGLNSGAYIKAQENQNRDTQSNLENSLGNVDLAENQASIPIQEAQKQREFQSSEAGKQREFAQGQQERQLGQQQSQFSQELPLKKQSLDMEAKKLDQEQQAMLINEGLAKYQNAHSGGLLGGGGFLGLGI